MKTQKENFLNLVDEVLVPRIELALIPIDLEV
jgi:hypothetical protein